MSKTTINLETVLRKDLYKVPPIEVLFKLTDIINKQESLYKEATSSLDIAIVSTYIKICKKLSRELTEIGKIQQPNQME